MLIHYVKQILRAAWRYKGFTAVNLAGLSLGIAAVLLIYLIGDYERRFDQFHSGGDQIQRVVTRTNRDGKDRFEAVVPYPMAKFLRNEHTGVQATQLHYESSAEVKVDQQSPVEEKKMVFADSLFFRVFDFSGIKRFVISGDPVAALSAPGKAVLTHSAATRYFGKADPIGKRIRVNTFLELEVAAVVRDPPPTTHLPFNMLVSFASMSKKFLGGLDPEHWGFRSSGYCYVRLDEKVSKAGIEKSLASIVQKNASGEREKRQYLSLQPISEIHFNPDYEGTNPSYTTSPRYLTMLLLLGIFILLIACVNYINLSTSVAFTKAKEVGIRKTVGASTSQLFGFYLGETLLLTSLSAVIGFGLARLLLPAVNELLDKQMEFGQLATLRFVLTAVAAVAMVSLLSGFYPSLVLTRFRPIESLKGQVATPGRFSTSLRKGLVVFQFATSIALVICTLVIAKQMHLFHNKSVGFDKEAVVEVELPSADSAKQQAFRSLLQNEAGIRNISFCLGAPISKNGFNTSLKAPELPGEADYNVTILACDTNYLQTYGIQLLAGRWFLGSEEKTMGTGLVVNETLVKTLGYRNPAEAVGKRVEIGVNDFTPFIIGVVKDFHTSSLHQSIGAVALMPFSYFYYAAGIRLQPGNYNNVLSKIEKAFKAVYPDHIYQYSFIDQTLAERYEQERRDYSLFKAFAGISIFICCIGLWGLIAFMVVRKTKEIGIRKVLGASIESIVGLLTKDFLLLIFIALLLASPIAWYFMHRWLENFAYRATISWWVFVLAGFFAVLVAFITVSFQAIKAAISNPVKSLRTE